MPRCVAVVAATLAALAGGAASASAAVRTASPGAGGDCVSAPCDIIPAINSAGSDDEVVIMPGDYNVGNTPLASGQNLNVHGVTGQLRPRITTTAPHGLTLLGTTTVSHLEVDEGGSQLSDNAAFTFGGTTATDVIARNSSSSGKACTILKSATLDDSVCEAPGQNAIAVYEFKDDGTTNAATLRNVDAVATGAGGIGLEAVTGGMAGDAENITVTNSIIRGITGGPDIEAFSGDQAARPVNITLDHSNFRLQSEIPGPFGTQIHTDQTDQRNSNPVFTAAGDYHQAANSPTIDKGADNALNGQFDFDGDARVFRTTDIGADEFYPPPAVLTGAPAPIQTTGATLHGTVNPNSLATGYHFDFGRTTSYGSSTPAADAGTGTAAAPVTAALTGLTPKTTYHYRLVATNPKGTSNGGDVSFTTLALTPPKKKVKCRVPKLKGLSLARAKRKLKAAHCRLGKVKRPKVRKGQGTIVRLVVKKQSPRAGKVRPKNTKVRVTLGPR